MQDYYGTKRISAEPHEKDGKPGYKVRYDHDYTSWSPKDVFDKAYRGLGNLSFGHAIAALRDGKRVRRASWVNGTWVVMMPELKLPPYNTQGTERKINDRTAKWIGEDKPLNCGPYFANYDTLTNAWQPGWVPSQEDMLADDWDVQD